MTDKLTPAGVEYLTLSGVRLHITPLNIPASKAILLMAADKYPYPDPTPYEKPMENAVEGMSNPVKEDPKYKALMDSEDAKRIEWANYMTIDYCVSYPDFSTRQDLLDTFAPKREALRKIAKFDPTETDWDITLRYLVFSGNKITVNRKLEREMVSSDYSTVLNLCKQYMELTGGEVLNGIRMFRLKVSGITA